MNTIQGKNINVFMKVDSVYYPIFCGKSMTFSIAQDVLETTNVNSGSFRDYEAGMSTSNLEISGVSILNNLEGRLSISYLMQQSVRRVKQDWKISVLDDNGTTLLYTFKGLIITSSFDKTIPGFSQSSVSIQVCGNVDIGTVLPPGATVETVYSDWWNFAEGNTSISGTSSVNGYNLIGVTVLEVDREGIEHDIITSGTPVNRQAKHNNGAGSITFSSALPSNGETVFVLFKRVV
jgi:hypothetical protein